MQEIKISGVSISPDRRYVLPTDEEIGFMKETGRQFVDGAPLAVRIRRIKQSELPLLTQNSAAVEQQRFQNICRSYPYFAFLHLWQFKRGIKLLPGHFRVMEIVQNIPEAKTITYYPPTNAAQFSDGLDMFESTYADKKEILPLLDPSHDEVELQKMVQNIIDRKYKKCAVIGRNFDLDGWEAIMPELQKNKVFTLVLGIYPRATRMENGLAYSMLCPPILMGAGAVSHGMAWSGGPSRPKRLERDWMYHAVSKGVANTRTYHDNRAEAPINANIFCKNDIKNKSNSEIISIDGFGHFSEFA